jgi:DNA-binding CsgD family transcriptional regulator
MERLRHADLDRLVRLSAELANEDDADVFPLRLLESLCELVGSDHATYCELDRPRRRTLAISGVSDAGGTDDRPDDEEAFWRLRHQHPVCSHQDRTSDFSPRKLSDFVSVRELRRLEIYSEIFRPADVEHELSVGLPAPLTHTKVFLFDKGPSRNDFGERERTILELLRPHLARRYEQVETRRRADTALAALDTCEEALVLLDTAGRAEFATPRALRLLATHGLDLADVPEIEPLTAQHVRPGVLLLAERRPLGLTAREREILALVAEGRSNSEVAAALWISPATVGKHLENVYAKLGVGTRTAAVQRAREHDAIARANAALPD